MGLRPCLISWNSWLLNPPQGVKKIAAHIESQLVKTDISHIYISTKVNILDNTDEKQGEFLPERTEHTF